MLRRLLAASLALLALAACDKPVEQVPARPAAAPASAAPSATAAASISSPARLPAPARIIAVGDLHGDLNATRAALRAGGVIDDKDAWIGGDAMLVQTGDQLDRGDDEHKILDLFDKLEGDAKAKGGSVVVLNGNHEVMNVALDFRYVTERGFSDFGQPGAAADPRIGTLPEKSRGRAAAFLPGGSAAKRLAKRPIVAVVGDNVFVHGGVSPKHVRYGIERMNREVSAWMNGEAREVSPAVVGDDGPIWLRRYSAQTGADDCKVLKETLGLLGAKRMIVGHTPQREGITSACEEQVWRIDVGLAKHYDGKIQVLEIKGDTVKTLTGAR